MAGRIKDRKWIQEENLPGEVEAPGKL